MLTIWFVIWFALSAALLYFLFWTLYILYRQKTAWRTYALKKKLRYNPKQLLASPEINGIIYGYTVSLFSGEHVTDDARGTRKLSAIEVSMASRLPFDAVFASGGMVSLARSLDLKEEMRPAHPEWKEEWIALTNYIGALESYLSPDRIAALVGLMKIKNAWVMLILRENIALLRVDTPDPLDTPQKIDGILKRMTDVAQLFELKSGEAARLKAAMTIRPRRADPVKIQESEAPGALALEEEIIEATPPVPPPTETGDG